MGNDVRNTRLNRLSSKEDKNSVSEIVYEVLGDFLFDKVNFLNQPGLAASGTTISTTTYDVAVRVPDTSEGKYIRGDRRSRLRTVFYFPNSGAEFADAYILSPCFYPSTVSISGGISSLSVFDFYVGIKILSGQVSLVAKDIRGERTITTNKIIRGTQTVSIEIKYNISNAEIYIDDVLLGSISTDPSVIINNVTTAYPLIAPIRNSSGAAITSGAFVIGHNYQIVTVGTTDFTLIGAASNTVGVQFTATGVGSGTGTAATTAEIDLENYQFLQDK